MNRKLIVKILLIVLPVLAVGLLLLQGYQSCAYRGMLCTGPDYGVFVWLILSIEVILALWLVESNYEVKRSVKISKGRRVAQYLGVSVIVLFLMYLFVNFTPVCGWIVQLGERLG